MGVTISAMVPANTSSRTIESITMNPIAVNHDRAIVATRPPVILLNAAVIAAPGCYRYAELPLLEALHKLHGQQLVSAIGHDGTAAWIALHLRVPCIVSRRRVTLEIGQDALVCRPLGRRVRPHELTLHEVINAGVELGWLQRLA